MGRRRFIKKISWRDPAPPGTPIDSGTVSDIEDFPAKPPATVVKLVMEFSDGKLSVDGKYEENTKELFVDGMTSVGWLYNQAKEWLFQEGFGRNVTVSFTCGPTLADVQVLRKDYTKLYGMAGGHEGNARFGIVVPEPFSAKKTRE